MIEDVQCPDCDFPLTYKKVPHWTGENDWFVCERCLCEYLYDLDIKELNPDYSEKETIEAEIERVEKRLEFLKEKL